MVREEGAMVKKGNLLIAVIGRKRALRYLVAAIGKAGIALIREP